MRLPYSDLKSERLQSLVTVIKVFTIIGYAGLLISIVAISNLILPIFNVFFFGFPFLIGSLVLLVISGVLALCVSAEETYRIRSLQKPNPSN